jgi:hypothetical protein
MPDGPRPGRLDVMEQHTEIPAGTTPAGTTGATSGTGTPTPHFTLRRSRTDRMLGGVCGGLAASPAPTPRPARPGRRAHRDHLAALRRSCAAGARPEDERPRLTLDVTRRAVELPPRDGDRSRRG